MKIGPLDSKPVAPPAAAERVGATAPLPKQAEASAQVDLSPEASLLSGMGSDPTFDSAKVERIAQAIREGQFKINPEAIADKLIVNAEELLGRKFS
ncbi:MAG: flagellar biosynthesis anti-sigma factor FlgM [Rubrivivax sp.]|jgi:negative regulator of flagellin synthesis FlgM|nr:flagellar biosynthesis anti-sigma factor FlgM [Rubrivivax sp.]